MPPRAVVPLAGGGTGQPSWTRTADRATKGSLVGDLTHYEYNQYVHTHYRNGETKDDCRKYTVIMKIKLNVANLGIGNTFYLNAFYVIAMTMIHAKKIININYKNIYLDL